VTEIQPENAWRTPQLVRDRMAVRGGHPERIVELAPDAGLALLIYKLHNELYEIEEEPLAEEIADFLTALQAVYDIVSPHWKAADPDFERHDPALMPLPAFVIGVEEKQADVTTAGYGAIHRLIQRFARNLLDRSAYSVIVKELALSAKRDQIDPDMVLALYMQKIKRHGGFDAHILRVDTRFQG
jgi:hypothetical protein